MRTVRVLVVDDNEDHRFLIERALRQLDGVRLEVTSVGDGEEALAHLHGEDSTDLARPHVVLLDLRMPRLGGLDVLAEVKNDPELRRIPVCVLTSSDRRDDVDRAYQSGTNAYVVKSQSMGGIRQALAGVAEFWGGLAALPDPP